MFDNPRKKKELLAIASIYRTWIIGMHRIRFVENFVNKDKTEANYYKIFIVFIFPGDL